MSSHRKAMQEAATLAFAEQLAPAVRDITRQLQQHERPHTLNLRPASALALAVLIFMGGTTVGVVAAILSR